ncbi:MAG: glycosyl transferase family 2 [Candidatus Sericytochromatia bacterium]|nr:MAG: glycosyl transferase family 2 [Candidatus Sericytochromatia bacterium]
MSKKDFTIAIPTYNRYLYLKEIINRLHYQIEKINLEIDILIVDDGSTDETYLISNEYKKLIYIKNENNLGIAKTRNLLVKYSNSKYIIFIDSDVIPSENFLIEHIKNARENYILQGVNILIPSIDMIGKNFNLLTDASNSFFDTSNLCIEKKLIEEANYFDENFYYGWEDIELGIRLKKNKNIKFIKNKLAIGYHLKTFPNNLEDEFNKEKNRAKGAIYFYNKYKTLEVKAITQINKISYIYFIVLKKLFFYNIIILLSKNLYYKNFYNISMFIFRFYMNLFYLNECFNQINKNKLN